jgi:hypothetical protein
MTKKTTTGRGRIKLHTSVYLLSYIWSATKENKLEKKKKKKKKNNNGASFGELIVRVVIHNQNDTDNHIYLFELNYALVRVSP